MLAFASASTPPRSCWHPGDILREALARLKARGHREARVGTAHFNHAAIAAYRAAGFEPADADDGWAKALDGRTPVSLGL